MSLLHRFHRHLRHHLGSSKTASSICTESGTAAIKANASHSSPAPRRVFQSSFTPSAQSAPSGISDCHTPGSFPEPNAPGPSHSSNHTETSARTLGHSYRHQRRLVDRNDNTNTYRAAGTPLLLSLPLSCLATQESHKNAHTPHPLHPWRVRCLLKCAAWCEALSTRLRRTARQSLASKKASAP